jgi:segregation and condensation protein B
MELKPILEAILFAAQKPMTAKEMRDVLSGTAAQTDIAEIKALKKTREADIEAALETLRTEHDALQRSYAVVCVAGAWQFVSKPDFAPWLMTLLGQKVRPPKLSQPALETLSIIAYRQPATRAEIEQVRGVAVDGVMQTLIDRGLIEQVGRAEVVGRPLMFGTTALFLEHFGLRALDDLPAADELRRIPVTKPEALLTADPNVAATAGTSETTPAAPPVEAAAAETAVAPAPVAEEPVLTPSEPAPTGPPPADGNP